MFPPTLSSAILSSVTLFPNTVTRFFHISDLHFGRTDPSALTGLAAAISEENPDGLVVTGDLTQSGRRREFEAASAYLSGLGVPIAVVPGNHDAPVYSLLERFVRPWHRFESRFGPVAPRVWEFAHPSGAPGTSDAPGAPDATENREAGGVSIIGVNSARRAAMRMDWSTGRLRRRDVDRVVALAQARPDYGLVCVATHHPVRLGPGKAGSERVGGASRAVRAFADAGVGLILTGHVHDSSIAILPDCDERLLSIASGSATSTRQRTENASFTAISIALPPQLADKDVAGKDVAGKDMAGKDVIVTAEQRTLQGLRFEPFNRDRFTRQQGRWVAGAS